MELEVDWKLIDLGTYCAIYGLVSKDLTVHASHTCMEGCEFHTQRYIMTAYGFQESPVPLIRSIDNAGVWTYWIAKVIRSN